MARSVALVIVLACLLPIAGVARAQGDVVAPEVAPVAPTEAQLDEARSLFAEGLARADEQRWGEAVEYFRRALTIVERPSIVFNLGVALFRLGRTSEARETLDHYLTIADAMDDASGITEAHQFLTEIEHSVGVLVLHITPTTAILEVDGAVVEGDGADRTLRLDPGTHHILVQAPRHDAMPFDVSVLPGAHAERSIDLPWVGVAPAHLAVQAPPDAVVLLDDDRVGRGPIALDVAPGEHTLRVETAVPYRAAFTLAPGEQRTVSAADISGPPADARVADDTWIWVLVAIGGACVIGAAIGVGVWASQPQADPFHGYGGTTGVVLETLRW